MNESSEQLHKLRTSAAKIGIVLPETVGTLPQIGCFGHQLPEIFIWFCRHYAKHSGFPHHGWEPPFGLVSPFGHESELQRHNVMLRQLNPNWPTNWISFWHGNDGDFCFSFDRENHPWIVYWYYNANYSDECPAMYFDEYIVATDFVDWFSSEVDWAVNQTKS